MPLSAEGVRIIESAPPKEFDGPGNQWSPEGLLTAAVCGEIFASPSVDAVLAAILADRLAGRPIEQIAGARS